MSPAPRSSKADRLLIIRLGAMGDVLRTLPAAQALRDLYPGAHLAWLVEPGAQGVVDASGIVDESIVLPRDAWSAMLRAGDIMGVLREALHFASDLRRRRFEVTLDFHGILKSGLLSRVTGAPLRIGFDRAGGRNGAKEGAQLFATRRALLPAEPISRWERNAALVRALSARARFRDHVDLAASMMARARLTARLRGSGRDPARGYVLVHPGSSRGAPYKRYPESAWAEVAGLLAQEGLSMWVVSGPNRHERILAERIVRDADGAACLAPETRSFDDLLALLEGASVFASGDSGPLHAASLVGVPVVQLLGPTNPVHNAPWPGTPSARVHHALACSPCRSGCATADCMRLLSPRRVADEIISMHRLPATAHAGRS